MTTVYRPAQGVPLNRGTQSKAGGMGEVAAVQVVPGGLRPFQVGLDGPGNAAGGLAVLSGAAASADEPGTPDAPGVPSVRAGVVSRCALFGRLGEAERVVQVSAPAGSGKTVLVRSWIAEAGLARRAAWVPVDGEQRDPLRVLGLVG